MSNTAIPEKIKIRLWAMAAGRCEYEGCNAALWLDDVTKTFMNSGYIAHIVADEPGGPRGDEIRSPLLAKELSNLMLMCDTHHRLIDREQIKEHDDARLQKMKATHETRITLVASIHPDKKSEVLLYGANVGAHDSPVTYRKAVNAMLPEHYPQSAYGISLGIKNSSIQDKDAVYWQAEEFHLRRQFAEHVKPRLSDKSIEHLSVFAMAPQPLLVLLGTLLSDIQAAEVFQLHKEPSDWRWQDDPAGFDYIVHEPEAIEGVPALVLELSANVTKERITQALGPAFSLWRVTIAKPDNDYLKSKRQLQQFRQTMRSVLNRIKMRHGEDATIHLFPVAPVAVNVEFGRVLMPKADLPLRIYDQNQGKAGFYQALEINLCGRPEKGK